MSKSTVALLCALLATACTGDDDPGGTADAAAAVDADPNAPDADPNAPDADPTAPDATVRTFANQIIADDCAPNDGPALRMLFTDDTIGAECRADGLGPSIEIRVWTRSITAPQTIIFTDENFRGSATNCLGGTAPCQTTANGEIRFDSYQQDVGATGTWRLEFGGSVQTGSFDVDWCDPTTPLVCG
jgi:hypothetical protein